mmetsp:Transcript_81716/g.149318  ORF Transcript_81716/g.149318 Transcript_81716/m.149318 type:complete len:234 (-) Transcript_81716:417-1118(-)
MICHFIHGFLHPRNLGVHVGKESVLCLRHKRRGKLRLGQTRMRGHFRLLQLHIQLASQVGDLSKASFLYISQLCCPMASVSFQLCRLCPRMTSVPLQLRCLCAQAVQHLTCCLLTSFAATLRAHCNFFQVVAKRCSSSQGRTIGSGFCNIVHASLSGLQGLLELDTRGGFSNSARSSLNGLQGLLELGTCSGFRNTAHASLSGLQGLLELGAQQLQMLAHFFQSCFPRLLRST